MKTWLEISKSKLKSNLLTLNRLSKKPLMVVLKSNAYGHGIKECVNIIKDQPLDVFSYYVTDSFREALIIHNIDSSRKILIIGWCDNQEIKEAAQLGFEVVAPSQDFLKRAISLLKSDVLKVHLKIETGTSRLGSSPQDFIEILKDKPSQIEVSGVYSHFANIEDTLKHDFARLQLERFEKSLLELKPFLNGREIRHFSCSASILLFEDSFFDAVRAGISLYGYWPSEKTQIAYLERKKNDLFLQPVLSWKAKVAQIKIIPKGAYVSYGLTFQALIDTKIAVIPVGYYEGYKRSAQGNVYVLIKGERAPVRGRICMNMMMVDVTHISNIREGDDVILLGKEGGYELTADNLADWMSTINYEVLANLSHFIPRKLTE